MGTQNGHNVSFLESASLKKRKRKAMKRIKPVYKISKRVKKKSRHLVPKVVIHLPFEGRKVEGNHSNRAEASHLKLYRVSVFKINNSLIINQIVSKAISCLYQYYDKKVGHLFT